MAARFQTKVLPLFFSGVLGLIASACGGSSDTVVPIASCDTSQNAVATASFDALWTNVFSGQCGSCHGSGTDTKTLGGPDLRTADGFYNGLVAKTGADYLDWDTYQKNREGCLAYNFIKSGDANQSVLTAVLDNTVSLAGCTVAYHKDAPQSICITSGNLSKLTEWINAGALR